MKIDRNPTSFCFPIRMEAPRAQRSALLWPRPSSILPPRRGVSGDRDENSSLSTVLSPLSARRTTRRFILVWLPFHSVFKNPLSGVAYNVLIFFTFSNTACILHRIIFVLRIRNCDYQWIQNI